MNDDAFRRMDHYYHQISRYVFNLNVVVNKEMRIVYIGSQGANMLGYEPQGVEGVLISDIVHEDSMELMRSTMDRVLKREDFVEEGQVLFNGKDGQTRTFRTRIFPVVSMTGDREMCIYGKDISELQDSMYALELMNKKLGILGSATRHDVLNSLTGLFGYLELAEVKSKDENVTKFIRKAKGSAEIIKKQIEFTRSYQEIGAKKPAWLNMPEVVRMAYASLNEHKLVLEADLGDLRILADPMMEKVIFNLLDNAHRHAEGATTIKITFQKVNGTGKLIIEDDGKGVPADEKEVIFKRGYGRNTGYGLYMSKEVLSITGMDIVEDGEPGKGARFTITVPAKKFKV